MKSMTMIRTAKNTTALSLLLLTLAVGCTRSVPDRITGGSADDITVVVDAFVADASGGAATAAQIPEPTGFGTITGTIIVKGSVDSSKFTAYNVNKDTSVCSNEPNRRVVVNNDGLQWGLLYYDGPFATGDPKWEHADYLAGAGADLSGDLAFDQKSCIFMSRIYAMRTNQVLEIKNSDTVGHNANLAGLTSANMQIGPSSSVTYKPAFQESKPFTVDCKAHPWMSSYIIVRDAPFFAVTGPDGSFQISNVPTGVALPFKFWHEVLPSGAFEITIDGIGAKLSRGKFNLDPLEPGEQRELNIVIDADLFNSAL
jgi:hypothetical protein